MIEHVLELITSVDPSRAEVDPLTYRSISDHQHMQDSVSIGVLHVRISAVFNEEVIDLFVTESSSECQWIFSVVGMS